MANSQERDIECGVNFNKLLELGCFDREFIVCGYAYMKNNEIYYLIDSNEEELYQKRNAEIFHEIYPTAIMKTIKRCVVPSGMKDIIVQKSKLELAKELQKQYNHIYFEAVAEMSKESASNEAYKDLKALQDEIDGHFCDEELQIFEGLCRIALESKTLQYITYRDFMSWLKKVRKQMEDDVIVKRRFQRTVSGFVYWRKNGQTGYCYDAQRSDVEEKRLQYNMQGMSTTSIYQKQYWFDDINDIPRIRKQFAKMLKQVFKEETIELFKMQKQYQSVIQDQKYQKLKQRVKENCTQQAYQMFLGYGYQWMVEKVGDE